MRTLGIIAEYNPVHNGHIYQLEEAKRISKADFVVAVMSGDFTQRGEPAVMDKWTRANLACKAGVDLVLEMPFVYATASAEGFAAGGVGILENLGIVDAISFGSESGDIEDLQFMASFLRHESPEFKETLKKHLAMGISFPKARELAVNECLGMDAGAILKSPNNILAIEYLKHVVSMTPVTVKRTSEYSSVELPTDGKYASASAIRKAVMNNNPDAIKPFVNQNTYTQILGYAYDFGGFTEKYYTILRSVILRSSLEELSHICGMSEGIENKIKKEVRNHKDYDSFAASLKSKRFTRSAIDRLMTRILVGMKELPSGQGSLYTKVLAFNDKGSQVLKSARETSTIPIVTNMNKYDNLPECAKYDVVASDVYNLIVGKNLYEDSDYVMHPCKVTEYCV